MIQTEIKNDAIEKLNKIIVLLKNTANEGSKITTDVKNVANAFYKGGKGMICISNMLSNKTAEIIPVAKLFAEYKNDLEKSELNADRIYSKAFLRHLYTVNEILGPMIGSLHNLHFYLWLVKEARKHIIEGDFAGWKKEMVGRVAEKL